MPSGIDEAQPRAEYQRAIIRPRDQFLVLRSERLKHLSISLSKHIGLSLGAATPRAVGKLWHPAKYLVVHLKSPTMTGASGILCLKKCMS